jgi:beta-glucosidase
MTDKKFPEGFRWGAATASYQVEGGIENCDWAEAARKGFVPLCGRACDHYRRFEADFDIAKSLGHTAHRFSVEWARIEPEAGKFDEKAIAHYRDVLRALQVRGITPYVTLWHFTLPLWFSQSGGFERKDSPEIFARYCSYVVERLSDLCEHFSTINEPNVWAGHGWIYGAWPPFKRGRILWKKLGKEDGTTEKVGATARHSNIFRYFAVEKHLAAGHCQAYGLIKAHSPQVKVSVVKHVRVFLSVGGFWNNLKAQFMQYVQTYRFMNAVHECCDEIALNYYRRTIFGDTKVYPKTDMGWTIFPEGIYYALKILHRYKKPIFVAEAGLADENDAMRETYIKTQVESTWRAIQEGVDVRGHMYWSLLDNYEWALGFEKRFGLVAVNYDTLERTVRPSAYVYKKICEENRVLE